MADKVRVQNMTPYCVGLKAQNGIEYNIRPRMFVSMSRDDVEYNMALAPSLFATPAQLVVNDEELNSEMGIDPTNEELCSIETATKYLKGTPAKLKAWLEENNKPHIIETVFEASQKMDLPASKIKVLKEFMPLRDFIDE